MAEQTSNVQIPIRMRMSRLMTSAKRTEAKVSRFESAELRKDLRDSYGNA